MPAQAEIVNLSDTSPAAPSGDQNVKWQKGAQSGTDPATGYPIFPVSASVPLSYYTVTWGVGIGAAATVASDVTPHYLVPFAGVPTGLTVAAKTAPTGADLIFDIWKNGTSIFSAPVHLAAGATQTSTTAFASDVTFAVSDLLTFNVNQVGSTMAGQDLTVQLVIQI
jgi:hypothetical protein